MNLLNSEPILLPVLVLALWTLVMLVWTLAVRVPAMSAAGLGPQSAERTADLANLLPANTQWPADNYNHLMEQPTLFYAVALALALAGMGDGLGLYAAWLYVASRVIHSVVHATINRVVVRLALFVVGTLCLAVMILSGIAGLL